MWDLEFTESKPLDDPIEDELMATGDQVFSNMYQSLLAHANDQQSADTDKASQVKLIYALLSCCSGCTNSTWTNLRSLNRVYFFITVYF